MKDYVSELGLDYDPFGPRTPGKEFYAGGERSALVDQLIELSLDGNTLAVVTGALGLGKTTVSRELRRRLDNDAMSVLIPATLFMNPSQFLEALGNQLPKHKHIVATPDMAAGVQRLIQYAAELDLEAQSLILIVDDAHELGAEVLELIEDIVHRASKSSVRAILLGEKQLLNLLDNTLSSEGQAGLAHFELENFGTEETLEYLHFKLNNAGLRTSFPFSGSVIGQIQNASNGIPGTINAHAIESLTSGAISTVNAFDIQEDFNSTGNGFSFDAHTNTQFDLDMDIEIDRPGNEVDTEEFAEFNEASTVERAVESNEVFADFYQNVLKNRYPVAASLLAVVMLITLFVWNAGDSPQIVSKAAEAASPNNTGYVNRIPLAPPVARPEPVIAQIDAPAVPTASVASQRSDSIVSPDVVLATPVPAAVTANTIAASGESAANNKPATAAPVVKPATPAAVKLSGFEQELMSLPANHYAIQILGSHSEANVQKFIAGKPLAEKHGYYATRHENKPWFVVVAGDYTSRAAASTSIERMPAALRSTQPWIRSLADIQRDIRQQNAL